MDQQLSSETVSQTYTQTDHLARQTDRYAHSKYLMTLSWLAPLIKQGQSLFNVGCGNGQFNFMASALGLQVWGFEPDHDTFQIAEKLLNSAPETPEQKSRIHLSKQNLFEISTETKADFLVMHDVLEHIQNDTLAVDQLAQLLKPAGVAVISVPAMPSLFGFHDEQLGHFRRYTAQSLRRVLESRFEIQKIRYFGASFIPIVYWFSVNKRKPYPHTAASAGLPSKILAGLCSVEEKIPLPLGTSVMALVRLRK